MYTLQNKKIISLLTITILGLSGCATNEGPTYDGNSYAQIKKYDIGVILEDKPVAISDDGSGKFLGTLVGAVLGSTMGKGNGNTLATLGGGIADYYAGNEIGDRVKIIKDGNKVAQVDLVTE